MVPIPETRYARTTDGLHIAYQVVGDGRFDLVAILGYVSHVELAWEDPPWRIAFEGFLLQSPHPVRPPWTRPVGSILGAPTLEDRMQDLRAVMDAAGSERAALFGLSGAAPCRLVRKLPGLGPRAVRDLRPNDRGGGLPVGLPPKVLDRYVDAKVESWGSDNTVDFFAPSVAVDPEFRRRWAAFERRATSPGAYRSLMSMNADTDVRDVLRSIRFPTLILHRSGDLPIRIGHARYLREHIAEPDSSSLPATTTSSGSGHDGDPRRGRGVPDRTTLD